MKPACAAVLIFALPACVERQVTETTIVSSVTPEQTQACVSAGAEARNVDEAVVTATSARATGTGPVVNLSVNGIPATCKLDELGNVEAVTFS
jgi:hypothetical protein